MSCPRSNIAAVLGALHLKAQLINQQRTCLSDELGGRPLKGAVDPAWQAIVRCRVGSMDLSMVSHGTVSGKWLLVRLVVSVLSGGPDPRITHRTSTATTLPRVAPKRPDQDLELEQSGI